MAVTYEVIVEWAVTGLFVYAMSGAIFAVAFVTVGVTALDAQARGSRFWFRLIIFPGSVALWPWLLRRWLLAPEQETQR